MCQQFAKVFSLWLLCLLASCGGGQDGEPDGLRKPLATAPAAAAYNRDDIYRFFVIAFGAAPGVTYMGQAVAAADGGASIRQIVNAFSTKSQFLDIYPADMSNLAFAQRLVDNVVGSSASGDAKDEAVSDIVNALKLPGMTRGDIIFAVFNNLAVKPLTDPRWGLTAQRLRNQVAHAKYHTDVMRGDTQSLAELRSVVATVTESSPITDAAISARLNAQQELIRAQAARSQAAATVSGVDRCLQLSSLQYLQAARKLIPIGSDFTVEFTFYLNSHNGGFAEVISQGGQPYAFYIGIRPDTGMRLGDSWGDAGVKMPMRTWVRYTLVYGSGARGAFYVDGQLIGTKSNYSLNPVGTDTRLGAQFSAGAPERIDGCIGDLRIWNRARSADEIATGSAASQGSTGDPSLLSHYDFNRIDTDGSIRDHTGNPLNALQPAVRPVLLATGSLTASGIAIPKYSGSGGLSGSASSVSSGVYISALLASGIPPGYQSGFGWYSTLWAVSPDPIPFMQMGLGSTWITPFNPTVDEARAQRLCDTGTNSVIRDGVAQPSSGRYGLILFQTIEGSLGWWAAQRFRTAYPKYMPNVTQNCYSTELATPGWGFFRSTPTSRSETGVIQISNRILLPPDGMTFEPDESAPQLGITWMALKLPRFDSSYPGNAGPNSWTLFMNSANFKGPLLFVAPQFWADASIGNPYQRGITLDWLEGSVGSLAAEWAAMPQFSLQDEQGNSYSKIPQLQFPVNASGDFVITRDFRSYSAQAIPLTSIDYMSAERELPLGIAASAFRKSSVRGAQSRAYQDGVALTSLSDLLSTKSLDNGTAYGFSAPSRSAMHRLPRYFFTSQGVKLEADESQVPEALKDAAFNSSNATSAFVYQYPSWWDESPAASQDLVAQLLDGTEVVYRWYRFVDQPALARFNLNATERANLQTAAEKMQRTWANWSLMQEPSAGTLARFDKGLLVTPPPGLELGFVPIVIRQSLRRSN